MRASRSFVAAVVLVVSAFFAGGLALADVDNSTGTNVQEGDNRSTTTQRGSGRSGDAVGGQVTGVVSSGRTSVDATNVSRDSEVSSGDVNGTNNASSFVGQNSSQSIGVGAADIENSSAQFNLQEGDNRLTLSQTANLSTGDGVGGQVIGVVTAAGGSASIVAANVSNRVDVSTGDADGVNDAAAFVGQNTNLCVAEAGLGSTATCTAEAAVTADIANSEAAGNLQEGDNRLTSAQSLNASTGDGVAGQVIGAVSSGATSIDATNNSTDVSVESGNADANNDFAGLAGQNTSVCFAGADDFSAATCTTGPVLTADITDASAVNVQEGDNRLSSQQSANATTGDGVAGQVIGAVTSAGGSTSIVAANTSRDSEISTGSADAENSAAPFAGQNASACVALAFDTSTAACTAGPAQTADIESVGGDVFNLQEGDNSLSANQSANAATGDGVAGQVIGAVSAGATSIDATNRSDGVSVDTGDTDATNRLAPFVGQNLSLCAAFAGGSDSAATCGAGPTLSTADIDSATAVNVQEGDNRASAAQSANATSGDGVGGQVIGAVTSAGGSASIVAANTTTNSDISTGEADAANDATFFVGLNTNACTADAGPDSAATCTAASPVGPGLIGTSDINDVIALNLQEGNNRLRTNQSANAATGDGVGGQVIGVVSAGATSVDATNRTDDSSVETGESDASNSLEAFVGLNFTSITAVTTGAVVGDISGVSGAQNLQEGDNSKTSNQTASASSGDAVAGQVTGVVTSAGGSASVVVANNSTRIDSESGSSDFRNSDIEFVGLLVTTGPLAVL